MNLNYTTRHARAFPLSDALCLPSGASKNGQGAPHRRPGVVISEQGFPRVPGRARVKKLAQDYRIRLATWNIGTLTGKTRELVDTMIRRRISIACLQETKWVGEKAREIEDTGYKLYYTGKDRHRNGVGIIVDKHLKDSVVTVTRKGDRIILVKLVIGESIVNIISAYAPQVGLDDLTKEQFWEQMDDVVQEIPCGEKLFIGGDFNGHVGVQRQGYEKVHGGFGFGDLNEGGRRILNFAVTADLIVGNTLYKKREEHLITFKSGANRSQIDYFLVRGADRLLCKDCKVIPGECLVAQHRLLVLDIGLKGNRRPRKETRSPRTRWWFLKGEKLEVFKERMGQEMEWGREGDSDSMWNTMADGIRRISKELLGESKGKGPSSKETWWWNDEVQTMVKAKKDCFKNWQKDRNMDNFQRYKQANREAKKAVSEAKLRAYDDFYARLDSKDGEKNIYKLAKLRERKARDFSQVKCIKGSDSEVLVKDEEIKDRWKMYFEKLLNEKHEGTFGEEEVVVPSERIEYEFYRRIQKFEVAKALKRMKPGKALGPDGIPIEVWRSLGDLGVTWLTKLFNKIILSRRMPDEWRRSTLVPIYKNKGDIQSCNNYRGIKLMSHTMKLWERVIEHRLRMVTTVSEKQFGFMPGRSTMEAIYLLRRLVERHRSTKKDLHMIFIDLEKAYDRVPRDIIWWVLERKGVTRGYIDVVRDMYEGAVTAIRSPAGETSEFPITVGLHQGSALSPYLFALVMDELTRHIQEDIPWCMLFADDIVLVDETASGVKTKLEIWREALESKGFRISRSKTEYMVCKFSDTRSEYEERVMIQDQEIPKRDHFRYLGSIISQDGEIADDVTHRIQVGWLKWRSATGVLCDKRVPTKLKGKFYRTAIRPAMLYGTECWPIKKQQVNKISVAEMRMLRWMCGKTRRDRIRNETIREMVGVAPIEEKLRENRLRWFGHVYRRPADAVVKRVDRLALGRNAQGRGRPKLTLDAVVRKDLSILGLSDEVAFDRAQWRKRIHVADPN
jgi:hypothetical protein